MTVQEAIKYVVKEVCEDCCGSDEPMGDCKTCGVKIALECMQEVEQYRALGTVEELKEAKMKVSVYEQIKWERDIAISQLEEIGISLGQKMDDIKEAREKQVAKKPIKTPILWGSEKRCPSCNEAFRCNIAGYKIEEAIGNIKHCYHCGQALKWGEEDEV